MSRSSGEVKGHISIMFVCVTYSWVVCLRLKYNLVVTFVVTYSNQSSSIEYIILCMHSSEIEYLYDTSHIYAYYIFEDRCSVALKYCVIKLPTATHTFGNNVKITSFPV